MPSCSRSSAFAPDETAETIADAVWPLPGFSPDVFEAFHQRAILTNAKSVLKNMLPALDHAFREHDPVRRLKLLAEGFLKSDGEPYNPAKAFTQARCIMRFPIWPSATGRP